MPYDQDRRNQAQIAADEIKRASRQVKELAAMKITRIHNLLLSTGNPQEVLDIFGTDATEAVSSHATFVGALKSLDVDVPVLPSGSITPNPDGTVTFSAQGATEDNI